MSLNSFFSFLVRCLFSIVFFLVLIWPCYLSLKLGRINTVVNNNNNNNNNCFYFSVFLRVRLLRILNKERVQTNKIKM